MSLREVARQLGVSPSFVSQVENGKSQPSVATLYSFAQLLDLSIDSLFEPKDESTGASSESAQGSLSTVEIARARLGGVSGQAVEHLPDVPISRAQLGSPGDAWAEDKRPLRLSVTAPGNRRRLVMDSGVVWEQLARNNERDLDFMEIIYPPGSSSTSDNRTLRHEGYEYGYLLEGELQITFGFEAFTLRAGEAVGLDSSVPHLLTNPGSIPARGIWFVHHRHG
jgi:transcriptional regulator with XRE-family HTH domain/quercetin dioxygenase-like cupin family protein